MLSKSDFQLYRESPLHLWIKSHAFAEPLPPTPFAQQLFQQGYEVEALAKQFLTAHLKSHYPDTATISFETTLTDGHYQSRIDALVTDSATQTHDLYEIKSGTGVENDHKFDVTFQYLVAKASLKVNKVFLVHMNKDFRKHGEIDLTELFVIEDMTQAIELKTAEVLEKRQLAYEVTQLETRPQEDHCFKPNDCAYPSVCFPDLPAYPIYDLAHGTPKQYHELELMGLTELAKIPSNFTLTHKQSLQLQSIKNQRPIIDPAAISRELNKLAYPLYFLDYETIGPAIPLHDGYGPYQTIVNQFSLHMLEHSGKTELKHFEFLATDQTDSAPALAKALCEVIGKTGHIIVWNKSFECGRNLLLAELVPEFKTRLLDINKRTYDLMEIFSKGLYVDYQFHGSASIKAVLPVLVPELSYKALEVNNGTKAMTAWMELVYGINGLH
jgi:hypothetical protein